MFILPILKLLTFFLRTFTGNSATALPGLVLERYFPRTLKKILNQFDNVVLITGTNGKTTTSRILCHLLENNKIDFITNSSGSNLIRGIASVVVQNSNFLGKARSKTAIFEVEEATLPKLVKYLRPNIIVVTNIFRDQLDAYGEIDKTYNYIKSAVLDSDNPVLVLNKDDDRVRTLASLTTNTVDFISLDEKYLEQIKFETSNESYNQPLKSTSDTNEIRIENIRVNGDLANIFDIVINQKIIQSLKLRVPGVHSTFNAAAVISIFKEVLQKDFKEIFSSFNVKLDEFEPAFGRGEVITINNSNNDSSFQIFLVKNPAGMNLNFHLLENLQKDERVALLLILNDNIADGRDVSWIWDCDFGLLKKLKFKNIFISGSRRFDMGLRVKYEGIGLGTKGKIFENSAEAIKELLDLGFEKIFVMPTYTAMLDFRAQLGKKTDIRKMWK
jgi:UDP-N-acetylmuramyl tripeptide synthase